MAGFKFRRQEAIAGFFVDFYCAELRLAIELDGLHHRSPQGRASDFMRDGRLARRGLLVVHVRNRDVSPSTLTRIVQDRAAEVGSPKAR